MDSKSFSSFYFAVDGEEHFVEEVKEYADGHSGQMGSYRGNMYCAECRQAALTFVHGASGKKAYLRRIPTSSHQETCSYNHEYASTKYVKQYFSKLRDREIEDKLDGMLRMLCREGESRFPQNNQHGRRLEEQNSMCIGEQAGSIKISKVLRRKSLNSQIDENQEGEIFVFYGKAKLRVEERGNSGNVYYLLQICAEQRGNKFLHTRTYRSKIKDNVEENVVYDIAMIGMLNFKYSPFSIDLIKPCAIKFCKSDMDH